MSFVQDQKSEVQLTHHSHGPDESAGDLPPAYDVLSIHQSSSHRANQYTSLSFFPNPNEGSSDDLPNSNSTVFQFPVANTDGSLLPSSSLNNTISPLRDAGHMLPPRSRAHKYTSWRSLLPFASSFSAKRARQSVLSIVSDLVIPTSRASNKKQKNVHEILTSLAETCAEHKLSLSTILQETSVMDHTPMYWAVVNYREELLVALLVHSRPLSVQTISNIRRACLASSNQALFHALRVCRPPFHRTDGIQVLSLRSASNSLLLDHRPLDEIQIEHATDRGFVVSFDIPLWQRRMKVIGQVSMEFIASGRMWSVTFFSTDPSSVKATSGKSKQTTNTWHVMVSLLETSPPTFFDSELVVDAPLLISSHPTQTPRVRDARSMTLPRSCDEEHQNRSSMYNVPPLSETHRYHSSTSPKLLPPTHPLRSPPLPPRTSTAKPPSISIFLKCGNRKLGRRVGSGEPPDLVAKSTTKPDTWSDHGVGYMSAVVSSLGEGLASHLLHEHSRYLLPDGTLRGRLEARFVRTEAAKNCIIC